MIEKYKKIKYLFATAEISWIQSLIIIALSLVVAAAEILSIGMLPPLLGAISGGFKAGEISGPIGVILDLFSGFETREIALYASIMIAVLLLIKNGVNLLLSFYTTLLSAKVMETVRLHAMRSIINGRYTEIQKEKVGVLSEITVAFSEKVSGLVLVVYNSITKIVMLLLGMVVIVFIDPLYMGSVLIFILVMWACTSIIARHISKLSKENATNSKELASTFIEEIKNLKYLKSMSLELSRYQRLLAKVNENAYIHRRLNFSQAFIPSVIDSLGGIYVALMLVVMLAISENSQVILVEFLPALLLLVRLLPNVQRINSNRGVINTRIHHLDELISMITRFEGSTELVSQHNSPSNKSENILAVTKYQIVLKNVSFSYGTDCILKNVNLSIESGKIVMLVGPSGGGKSTLLGLLAGLYQAQSGSTIIDNGINEVEPGVNKSINISVALQEPLLYHLSVRDNIRFPDRCIDDDVLNDTLEIVGAVDFISKMSNGIDTIITDDGSSLSGGQRQRISLARAISHRANILLLDEATSALDPTLEERVLQNLVKRFRGNTTIIMVTHRLSNLDLADQIYYVNNEKLQYFNSKKEFIESGLNYS